MQTEVVIICYSVTSRSFSQSHVITSTDSKAMTHTFVKYSESHQSMTRAGIQYSVTEICRTC